MAETPDSGAAAAPASTAAVNTPRGQRQQRRQRRSRGVVLALAAVGAAGFTAVALWLSSSEPPYVTHREVMAMAVAIENAQSLDELRPLVRFDGPPQNGALLPLPDGESVADIAARIWSLKSKFHYTFLGARDEQTERPRLLFRANTDTLLWDYHELRIERDASGVKVVDLYSMVADRWLSEFLREHERLGDLMQGPQATALKAALAARDGPGALSAYRALPEALRAPAMHGVLMVFPDDERVLEDLLAQERNSLVLGFEAVRRAQLDSFANKPAWLLEAALQTLPRIYARTDDDLWCTSLRNALRKALGAK